MLGKGAFQITFLLLLHDRGVLGWRTQMGSQVKPDPGFSNLHIAVQTDKIYLSGQPRKINCFVYEIF